MKTTLTSQTRALAAAGVVAAAVIAVCANVLVSRFYARWDWTSRDLYTLSPATVETLRQLDAPIEVVVFLSQSDPLTVSVRHMLDAYGAETRMLRPRFVDPDRDAAEFLALQESLGVRVEGKTEDGRLVTDASIVLTREQKRWFLTTSDIFAYDDEGRVKSKLEQSLTSGIRNVVGEEKSRICFSTGHGEISSDDGGPQGLAELRFRLEKNNFESRVVDLTEPERELPLAECSLLVVAGPEEPFQKKTTDRLVDYLVRGGNVFLFLNPQLDDEVRIRSTGLERLAAKGSILLGDDFVIEESSSRRLPMGLGETFLATPKQHAITRGLVDLDEVLVDVLVSSSQSMSAGEGKVRPVTLLATSQESYAVSDIRPFVEENQPLEKGPNDKTGPLAVAMAAELPKPAGSEAANGPRIVVAGSANLAWGRNWREPGGIGARVFVESAVSWLAARGTILDIPEKPAQEAGMRLTEESMNDVLLYVLLYMPGASLVIGFAVLYRRRSVERKSRRQPDPPKSKRSTKPDPRKPESSDRKAASNEEDPDSGSEDAKSSRDEPSDSGDDAGPDDDESSDDPESSDDENSDEDEDEDEDAPDSAPPTDEEEKGR